MKDKKLCGIMPALMTAFSNDSIDTKAVAALCTHVGAASRRSSLIQEADQSFRHRIRCMPRTFQKSQRRSHAPLSAMKVE